MTQSELGMAVHYLGALKNLFKLVGERGDNWMSVNRVLNDITKRMAGGEPAPTRDAYWWYKNLKRGEKQKLAEVLEMSQQSASNIFSCKQSLSKYKEEMIKLKVLQHYKESLEFNNPTHEGK